MPAVDLRSIGSLIDGKMSDGGPSFAVNDRYTGGLVARVNTASPDDIDGAVSAAQKALRTGAPGPAERFAILRRAADLLAARRAELIETIVAETGFTLADAAGEVDRAVVTASLCAEEARSLVGETVSFGASPGGETRYGFTIRVPVGIVCVITPFNSPLNTVLHKIGPALAAGNAVILKPSGLTPLSAHCLGGIMHDAGLPSGFLSIVHGLDAQVGRMLLAQQEIQFFAFTGSTAVGREIQKAAGLRRTQLELGSVASAVVCSDADLDRAASKIANAAFRKAGQVCTSVQCVHVDRSRERAFTERFIAEAKRMPAGDPRAPETRVGPLISEEHAKRAESWIASACEQQARVLCGGARVRSVLTPTVLSGARRGMKVVDEEIFAPVVSIVPFDDVGEVIDEINRTPFGLSAGVFTESMETGLRLARGLRFGAVHLNESSSARADGMPFGGVKDSGFGKEGPKYAVREMTEERLVTLNLRA